jgi:general secretion pathway protein M
MNALVRWFKSLEQRERILVAVAGALLAIVLIYALVAPFNRLVDARAMRVEQKRQDLAWLRSVSPAIRTLAMSQPGTSGESLVVLIDRTARQAGIASAVTAQTPNGEHGMRVRLEAANFDNMIVWLASLQQQYGVSIESASFDRTDKSGVVNASVVLIRAGGHG